MVARISLGPDVRFTKTDVLAWAGSPSDSNFYNSIAFRIAEQYHHGALSYEVCDHIVNDLWRVVLEWFVPMYNKVPYLFYDVYLAFDAGEYYRTADRSDDPVAEHTKPMIKEIILRGSLRT